jgi:hypothetical protein
MILILAALLSLQLGAQPVHLKPYPQKFRTFLTLEDPGAPPMKGLSVHASDGAVWTGTSTGLWRRDEHAAPRDRVQYFAGKRYLPDDEVTGLAPGKAGDVWVRTKTGMSHIELRPMTLAAKAGLFEERVSARHDRHGLVAGSHLREPGNLATNVMVSSDNDGLWTAMYAAGECFRYAVTHSSDALARARHSIEAILFLEQVTGHPGFPARSYIDASETRPRDGKWYPSTDGKLQWKADTSSDEIVGHFLIFGIAWDLLPAGDPLKPRIAATARRIMDHIIEHGYNLVGVTGQPTTWGKWSQSYFDTTGRSDSPLNAIELLSFLKTAHHITGDAKYGREYRKVALDLGYADIGTRYLERAHEINYSDEELAMLSFYPLFVYEKDERLREYYRRAAAGWWRNIARELNPLWTFIYALGQPQQRLDFAGAAWTLYRIPMDLVEWRVDNSQRSDIDWEPATDRFKKRQMKTLLAPDERPIAKWNSNVFRAEGGNGGRGEDDGAFFLLPYWMGRYHRFLAGE